jgi:hypothetical protein
MPPDIYAAYGLRRTRDDLATLRVTTGVATGDEAMKLQPSGKKIAPSASFKKGS